VVDCSALQGSLLETELFGHEKGAFTGAAGAKMGLVELADGGTLFVDEIGDMPPDLQSKLLRILDCGEFRRVGALKERKVDMRIVAATNRNLAQEVRRGRFRKDLYFRLNVLSITMPPLRERREDIPLLAKHFAKHNRVTMAARKRLRADTLRCLQAYDWPGNIRELANVVERAIILAGPHTALQPSHLPPEARAATAHPERTPQARSLAQAEKETIEAALAATKGNRSKAAEMLGTSRMTLRKMMNQHGIVVRKR
jgi:transcriptional regulator with GAF, ATPase, and Fis domain